MLEIYLFCICHKLPRSKGKTHTMFSFPCYSGYLTKEKLIESWFLEVIFYTFHNLQFLNSNNTSSLPNCKASCHFVSVSLNPIPIVSSSECIVPIRVVVINMW